MSRVIDKKQRNIVLAILSVIAGIMYLTPLLRFSFYDQMLVSLEITDIQLGTIGATYGLFNVISYVPSGILADKFNTKFLLVLSCVAMCLVTIWYSVFPGYKALIVIHALFGIFSVGTFWSPYLKAIRNLGPEEEQGRLFGISEALRGVGQTIVAFICLGALGAIATVAAGFRAVLLINAGVFALLAVLVILFVPDLDKERAKMEAKETKTTEKVEVEDQGTILQTLKSSSTWLCIFVIACGYTVWITANSYLGTYGVRVLKLSPQISSAVSILRSYIIVFVAGVSGGILMDKFEFKGHGLFLAFLATGICALATYMTSSFPIVALGVTILIAYFVNVIKSTYWSILGEAGIPMAMTGMATGVISFIGLTPDIFVPPIISRFIEYGERIGNPDLGFNMMLGWMVAWGILGMIAATFLKKRGKKLRDANANESMIE